MRTRSSNTFKPHDNNLKHQTSQLERATKKKEVKPQHKSSVFFYVPMSVLGHYEISSTPGWRGVDLGFDVDDSQQMMAPIHLLRGVQLLGCSISITKANDQD
jgi:hypothetical protein